MSINLVGKSTTFVGILRLVDQIIKHLAGATPEERSRTLARLPVPTRVASQARVALALSAALDSRPDQAGRQVALRRFVDEYRDLILQLDATYSGVTEEAIHAALSSGLTAKAVTTWARDAAVIVSALDDLKKAGEEWLKRNSGKYGAGAVRDLLSTHPVGDPKRFVNDFRDYIADVIIDDSNRESSEERVQGLQQESEHSTEELVEIEGAGSEPDQEQADQQGGRSVATRSFRDRITSDTATIFAGAGAGLGAAAQLARSIYDSSPAEVQQRIRATVNNLRDRAIESVSRRVSSYLSPESNSDSQGGDSQQPSVPTAPPTVRTERQATDMASTSGNSGDTTDGPVDTPIQVEKQQGLGAKMDAGDATDGILGKRSLSTVENTVIAKVARLTPPNAVVSSEQIHVMPIDYEALKVLVDQMMDYIAGGVDSSPLYSSLLQTAAARLVNPSTYQMTGQQLRADVRMELSSDPWRLSATVCRLRTSATDPNLTSAGFGGISLFMPIVEDGTIKSAVEHKIDEQFLAAVPPVDQSPDRWFYLAQNSQKTTGLYSEVMLARMVREHVATKMAGSLWVVLARMVAELGRSCCPIVKDNDPGIGAARFSMREPDTLNKQWREWQTTGYSSGSQYDYQDEPIANYYPGDINDYLRLKAVNIAVVGIERFAKSHLGDNTVPKIGVTAAGEGVDAIPADWSLSNTCIVPLRNDHLSQGEINMAWLFSHFGLTSCGAKEGHVIFPREVGGSNRIDEWKTAFGLFEFAATSVVWPEVARYQHILVVLIDASTPSGLMRFTRLNVTATIPVTGPNDPIQVAANFWDDVIDPASNDNLSIDTRVALVACVERFDEMYATGADEVRMVVDWWSRFGFWCNEEPKAQDEQAAGPLDRACNIRNVTGLSDNVQYNSWPAANFRTTYMPAFSYAPPSTFTDMVGNWTADLVSVGRPVPVAHHVGVRGAMVMRNEGFNKTTVILSRCGTGSGPKIAAPKEVMKLARAMKVVKVDGPKRRAAGVDWVEFWTSCGRAAGDIVAYGIDDVLAAASVSQSEYKFSEYGFDNNQRNYHRDAKLRGVPEARIEMLAGSEVNEWKWTIKDASTSVFFKSYASQTMADIINPAGSVWDNMRTNVGALCLSLRRSVPKRVFDASLMLHTSGPVREMIASGVTPTVVDFSLTGVVKKTNRIPQNAGVLPVFGELLPQFIAQGQMTYATPADLKLLSRLQNVDTGRRAAILSLEHSGTQPLPFRPIECALIHPWINSTANLLTNNLPTVVQGVMDTSTVSAKYDLRDNTRPMMRLQTNAWDELVVKQSDNIMRVYGGMNSAMPLTTIRIPTNATAVIFDSENVGVGDPERQFAIQPDLMN